MSGFIGAPAEDMSPAGAVLKCGAFWPDIDLNHFRDTSRVGNNTIPDPRLTDALQGALLDVTRDLSSWTASQQAAGYDTLTDVPSDDLGESTRLVLLWRRAVYAYATAALMETQPDPSSTTAGLNRAEDMCSTVDDLRRTGLYAIRDILGEADDTVSRNDVELI
jgi:hypothetical protein